VKADDARVRDAWSRIHRWLRTHAKNVLDDLRPPAVDAAIAATERALDVELPESLRASFRVHDGQSRDGPGLFPSGALLSLETIVAERAIWIDLLDRGDFQGARGEAHGPVRDDWWNRRWIPLTYDGSGNHECLDLDPAPGGEVGQIIEMFHDEPTRRVTARSFVDWLEASAERMESGKWVYSEDCGRVLPREDA